MSEQALIDGLVDRACFMRVKWPGWPEVVCDGHRSILASSPHFEPVSNLHCENKLTAGSSSRILPSSSDPAKAAVQIGVYEISNFRHAVKTACAGQR